MNEATKIINEEDLKSNPELIEKGYQVGDQVLLSRLGTRDGDNQDIIPKQPNDGLHNS
jgi:hypothetical protein